MGKQILRQGAGPWAAFLMLGAMGCSNSPLPEPENDADVRIFPPQQTASVTDAQAEPFRVERHTFSQKVKLDSVFTMVFDADMHAGGFGVPASASPLVFSPPIKGDAYWWGARTLTFRPNESLAPGQTYEAKLNPELRSLAGKPAHSAFSSTFETPEFRAPSFSLSRSRSGNVTPETMFHVRFAHDVEMEDVRKHVALTHDGASLPFELLSSNKAKVGRRFTLKPSKPLPYQGVFKVLVSPGVRAKIHGTAWNQESSKSFKGIGDFKVLSIECSGYKKSQCMPNSTIYVRTSAGVKKGQLDDCVRVTSSNKTSIYASSWLPGVSISAKKGFKPGKEVKVSVSGACKDRYNRPLSNSLTTALPVGHHYSNIQAIEGFHTMEHSASMPWNVRTRNLKNVQVRLARVTPKDAARFNLGDDYSSTDLFAKGELKADVTKALNSDKEDVFVAESVELNRVLDGKTSGLVFVQVTGEGRFNQQNHIRKALLSVTDLGVHVKASPSKTLFWVTGLSSGKPASDTNIELFSVKGVSLWKGTTDAQGLAVGPGQVRDDLKRARYVLATKGDDVSWSNLDDWSSKISSYKFESADIGGPISQGALGHLFTERGVYRPGEPVHVKGFVRQVDSSAMDVPKSSDAVMTIKDGRGKVVFNKELSFSALGGIDATLELDKRASLGWYNVTLKPKGSSPVSSSFRVEAYRAPTFEVKLKATEGPLRYDQPFNVDVTGRYFFGAPMTNAPIRAYASTRSHRFTSPRYKNFSFSHELWWNRWSEGAMSYPMLDYKEPKSLGMDGRARMAVTLKSPLKKGMMSPKRVSVDVSVDDVDGQQVASATSVVLHPSDHYVGLKIPGYVVKANTPQSLKFVSVDLKGQAVSGRKMTLDVYRRQWVSVKKKAAGGSTTWDSRPKDTKVASCTKLSTNDSIPCEFSFKESGSYIAHVQTEGTSRSPSSHARAEFYVWSDTGSSWWRPEDGHVVKMVADKKSYKVGDTARLLVQSPFDSAQALVTIEREGIMSQRMIPVKSSKAIEVPITQDMMPNAFVSVSLVRGAKTTVTKGKSARVAPAFRVGYASLRVESSSKKLDVGIKVEPTHRPGEKVDVDLHLKDAQGRPVSGEVTLMAVQEGVLQLTGYRTPNPHAVFYGTRGLGVHNYSSILQLLAAMKAEGRKGDPGGGGTGGKANEYRNNFATTAAFLPTVMVPDSGKKSVSFTLPDNLTSYRIMAVAVGQSNTFGSSQERITVNKPLLVRPSLPRFATLGDAFKVRAIVQGLETFKGGQVEVRATTARGVRLIGEATRTITLAPGQSELVSFDAVVDGVGEPAQVRVSVDGAGAKDGFSVELPLRYGAPTEQIVEMGTLTTQMPALWREIRPLTSMHKEVGELEVTLSSSALSELIPSLEYVVGYPYGCAEQTTSRTLPMVWLKDQIKSLNIASIESDKVEPFIHAGIDRLFSMQTNDGGIGYWMGDSRSHPWASAYAGLAIVHAHNTGHRVDPQSYKKFLGYMKTLVSGKARKRPSWGEAPMLWSRVMASYVLSMAGEGDKAQHDALYEQRAKMPAWAKGLLLLSVHRQRAGGASSERAKIMLKGLYDDIMKDVTVANGEATLSSDVAPEAWMVMSSDVRSNAIALMATLAMEPESEVVGQFATGLLRARRQGRWSSTQSNAFASIALAQYFQRMELGKPEYNVHVGLGGQVFKKSFLPEGFKDPARKKQVIRIPMANLTKSPGKDNLLTLAREGNGGALYYTLTLRHAPAKLPDAATSNGFQVKRQYLYASGPKAGKPLDGPVKMGDTLMVRLSVVVPGQRHYVALEDPLPPGFEIVDTTMNTTSSRYSAMLKNMPKAEQWLRPLYTDYTAKHDDRVELFINDLNAGVYTHAYLVRATTPGSFNVSGTYIHEMYQPGTMGRAMSASVEILP